MRLDPSQPHVGLWHKGVQGASVWKTHYWPCANLAEGQLLVLMVLIKARVPSSRTAPCGSLAARQAVSQRLWRPYPHMESTLTACGSLAARQATSQRLWRPSPHMESTLTACGSLAARQATSWRLWRPSPHGVHPHTSPPAVGVRARVPTLMSSYQNTI